MSLLLQIQRMRSLITEETVVNRCPKCGAEQPEDIKNCKRESCGAKLNTPHKKLQDLNEGFMDKLKNVGMATAITAGSMLGGNNANAQSNQPHNTELSKPKASDAKLSGNSAMDHNNLDKRALAKYKEIHPEFWVKDSNDIKLIQGEILKFRESCIADFKMGKDKAVFDGQIPGDTTFSNFMPAIIKTGQDGINGQFTSTFQFPITRLNNQITGLASDKKALAGSRISLHYNQGLTERQMNEWNSYVDWLEHTSISSLAL